MSDPTPQGHWLVKLIARFVHKDTGQPVNDPGYRVQFFDEDVFADDFLGQSSLSADGVAEILLAAGSFQTGLLGKIFERLRERRPDIYCRIVDKDGTPMFRSTVRWNVDVVRFNEVTGQPRPTVDLGDFAYRAGEGLDDPPSYSGILRPMI